jgi:SAM-dependent methyltransferase
VYRRVRWPATILRHQEIAEHEMKALVQSFFDKRPELKEKVARAMFRTRLFTSPSSTAKARCVGYDHTLFRDALRDNANKNGRELHSLMHMQHVLHALRALDKEPRGEILEIGAGRAGLPVLLLLCGFDRVHTNEISNAVNRFEKSHLESLQVFASLMGIGKRKLTDIIVPLDDDHCAIHSDLFQMHAFTDAARLNIAPGTLSAVISFTVLEHLRDPRAVFSHLRKCLTSDGWMCHVVDMRDHEDFTDPLRFLTVGKSQYQNARGDWCNRLRHSDFLELFSGAGFELCGQRVTDFNELDDRKSTDFWKMMTAGLEATYQRHLDSERSRVSDEFFSRIHPDYRRYSQTELSILQAEYVLRVRDATD